MEQGGLMSAINSNSSDGDLEAIHRAQRAHEPSMEEILASIRNIIADDPARDAALKRQLAPTPQIVYSKDAPMSYGDASGLSQRPDANAPTVVWRRPQAVEAEPAAEADAVQHSAEPLLSPEADEAVALSFGALSANLEVRSAELADSMVRDMLRPMVKAWLDDNLPSLVERLVREEIQRVARGRK
jgi:cell pole-organizing protein PopZ